MADLRVGDRSPKAIPILISTSSGGASVTSVRVKAYGPDGELDKATVPTIRLAAA